MFKAKLMFSTVAAGVVAFSALSQGAIVINEVYGGGGNAGATFNADFIELFNNDPIGTAPVTIGGYTVQQLSAAGTTPNTATITAGTTLAPGAYYVIAGAASATNGAPLPVSNQTVSAINASATAAKFKLFNGTTLLDLVGVGTTANEFETAPAVPLTGSAFSNSRVPNGSDTNNNAVDFVATAGALITPGAANAIPEPTTLSLLGLGGLALLRRKRA